MLKTIKSKFIILSILFITISVGIPLHFLVNQLRENFEQRSEMLLSTTLDMLYYGLENAMMLGDQKNIDSVINQINKMTEISHIRIFNEDGEIRYSNNKSEIGKNILVLHPNHIKVKPALIKSRIINIEENREAYSAIEPILNKSNCQGCHGNKEVISYLDVDSYLTQAEVNFFTGTFHLLFLGVAVVLILIIGFIILFNYFINNHIQLFIKSLNQVEEGHLETRLPPDRKDEFGVLNRHFNNMVSEIQTSRQKIEQLHFEKLRHLTKLVTVGELTAQMAHEINNYIAIIFSRTDYLLLESINFEGLKKFKPDLDVIQNQISKVSKITGNILRHSKKLSTEFKEIDLVSAINQSIQILEPILPKKRIELKKNFYVDSAVINGDAQQIEEIIINLVNNSVDAIQSDGLIEITLSGKNNKYELEISDNGCGINHTDFNNIFSPFFTTKGEDKGTGLGLYIVKNICKNHKADISVESRENKGTKFLIIFNKTIREL